MPMDFWIREQHFCIKSILEIMKFVKVKLKPLITPTTKNNHFLCNKYLDWNQTI